MAKQVEENRIILDNYTELSKFIKFPDTDVFYFLEILKRKKDNPEMKYQVAKIYSKFITKQEAFDRSYEEVKIICNLENARAYLSIVPRSLEKLTKECALEFTRRVCSEVYIASYKIPDEIALINKTVRKDQNIWLLDVDDSIEEVLNYIKTKKDIQLLGQVETFSGIHIFCKPFNYPNIFSDLTRLDDDNFKLDSGISFGIKKSALSILYASKKTD